MGSRLKTRLWRLAFLAACVFAIIMASLPPPPLLGNPPDKLLHAFAFAVLTLLARLAYPRARGWHILLGLGLLGAAIECIQAIPALGREASLTDWLADMLAVGFVLGVMAPFQRRLAAGEPKPALKTPR